MKLDPTEAAVLLHDSMIILDVTDAFCELFQCDHDTPIGLSIFDLVFHPDFQGLGKLRMRLLREHGRVPPVTYLFNRFDGSLFYGDAVTEKVEDGRYQSIIIHKYEERSSRDF
ncbi:MAG: PAS domain-containing protein [Azonexus sp.]